MSEDQATIRPTEPSSQDPWAWLKRHPMLALWGYVILVSAVFLVFPRIDLWVSSLFYWQDGGFIAEQDPFLRKVRHLGPHLVKWIAVGAVGVLLLKVLLPGHRPLLPLRIPTFLISTLILGPGVLVNTILKDNWGRPRPRSVEEFGGDLPHQLVWVPTDYCDRNCSFVSGEASASIWLVGTALIVPKTWRFAVLVFTVPLCVALSANRIAFGGHFFSDTLLSWGLTLILMLSIHWLLYKAPFHPTDAKFDLAFTRFGRRLHIALGRLMRWLGRSLSAFWKKFQDLA
ncbi:PA-phosphatase related phosphoesterase [Roseibium sp. TrichSKD4]|uniref:phosphatase PAP2 family protein n=1 Tax=Roseibium sp. TrichSKD4 TaxID=744980 RepID=UPI0001E56C21|nr:phosphatase PAP2 family protein [Roseibium sp. TrichSKD4]EFO32662.1 PA-phosphatase related phosphoesterase [Roseibium sp. TrichSKD4]